MEYTMQTVCEATGVKESTIKMWIHRGQITLDNAPSAVPRKWRKFTDADVARIRARSHTCPHCGQEIKSGIRES